MSETSQTVGAQQPSDKHTAPGCNAPWCNSDGCSCSCHQRAAAQQPSVFQPSRQAADLAARILAGEAFTYTGHESPHKVVSRELLRLRERLTAALTLCANVIEVHEHVVMDTPEDRDLHDRAVATFRTALVALRDPA